LRLSVIVQQHTSGYEVEMLLYLGCVELWSPHRSPHLLYDDHTCCAEVSWVGSRGRDRPLFNALSRSPVFNLCRACSEAPSQHALERGPMKEAIDFCRLQRGPFYLCPLGGWGRRSARPMGLGRSPGGVADQRKGRGGELEFGDGN